MNDQDEREIINVINRYGIAVDARRWDLLDTIFSTDSVLEYPLARWDFKTFQAEFPRAHDRYDATQHAMMNHLVDVAGDTARAFVYCSWRLISDGAEGGDTFEGTAWYDDTLVRTSNGWRIKRRVCRTLWTAGNPRVIGAARTLPSDRLRLEAAEGKVGYLEAIDARNKS